MSDLDFNKVLDELVDSIPDSALDEAERRMLTDLAKLAAPHGYVLVPEEPDDKLLHRLGVGVEAVYGDANIGRVRYRATVQIARVK